LVTDEVCYLVILEYKIWRLLGVLSFLDLCLEVELCGGHVPWVGGKW